MWNLPSPSVLSEPGKRWRSRNRSSPDIRSVKKEKRWRYFVYKYMNKTIYDVTQIIKKKTDIVHILLSIN